MFYDIEGKIIDNPPNYRIIDVHKCVYADGASSVYLCDLIDESINKKETNMLVLNDQDADDRGSTLYLIGWVVNGRPEEWEINDGNNAYAYTNQFFNKLIGLPFNKLYRNIPTPEESLSFPSREAAAQYLRDNGCHINDTETHYLPSGRYYLSHNEIARPNYYIYNFSDDDDWGILVIEHYLRGDKVSRM